MSNTCCGCHIVKCAKILSIIGMVLSLPNILSAAIFFAVYYGLEHNKSSWLLPAVILLGVSIAFAIFLILLFTIFAIIGMQKERRAAIILILPGFLLLGTAFHIFSFIVINNARKYIIASKTHYPDTTTTADGYPY